MCRESRQRVAFLMRPAASDTACSIGCGRHVADSLISITGSCIECCSMLHPLRPTSGATCRMRLNMSDRHCSHDVFALATCNISCSGMLHYLRPSSSAIESSIFHGMKMVDFFRLFTSITAANAAEKLMQHYVHAMHWQECY
jgi:hypothetical protein